MAPLQRSTPPPPAIQHYTHCHPLQKLFMGSQFNCDGCNTGGGVGIRYRCTTTCDFDLHEQCATAPHRIFSHVHPHHHLFLVNRAGIKYTCDVCRGFADGISYTCRTCEFDVHPLCTQVVPVTPYLQPSGVLWTPPMTAASRGDLYHEQPLLQQQQQGRSSNYSKAAKFAANILMTSLTGMPSMDFNSTNNQF